MCGIYEGYNEDMFDDSDIVDVDPLFRFNVCFVFKQNLTNDQICLLEECIPDVTPDDHNPQSSRRFSLRGSCEYPLNNYDVDDILSKWMIPWELANLLSCIKFSLAYQPPILLFQSDLLLRRSRLIKLVNSQFYRYPNRDVQYSLWDITLPCHKLLYSLTSFSAEMIASHFFFNPKVINPIRSDIGFIRDGSERSRDEIREDYRLASKVITFDISQKVVTYNSPAENPPIDNWFRRSRVCEIIVREEPNECDHRICCILQTYLDRETYTLQSNILAFV